MDILVMGGEGSLEQSGVYEWVMAGVVGLCCSDLVKVYLSLSEE